MANRIYPAALPNPNAPLGYDGDDFRALRIDNQTDGVWALRVSLIPDRGLTKVMNSYSGFLAAHGATQRYTYTIAAGKRGLLEAVVAAMENPTAGTLLSVYVAVNGVNVVCHTIASATVVEESYRTYSFAIWLTAGDIVTASTYSNDATARTFLVNTCLSVFDA